MLKSQVLKKKVGKVEKISGWLLGEELTTNRTGLKTDSFCNHKLMRPRETKLVNSFVIFRS